MIDVIKPVLMSDECDFIFCIMFLWTMWVHHSQCVNTSQKTLLDQNKTTLHDTTAWKLHIVNTRNHSNNSLQCKTHKWNIIYVLPSFSNGNILSQILWELSSSKISICDKLFYHTFILIHIMKGITTMVDKNLIF